MSVWRQSRFGDGRSEFGDDPAKNDGEGCIELPGDRKDKGRQNSQVDQLGRVGITFLPGFGRHCVSDFFDGA